MLWPASLDHDRRCHLLMWHFMFSYNCAKYKILRVFPTASPLRKHAWSTLIDGTVLGRGNLQLFIFSAFKPIISQSAPGVLA